MKRFLMLALITMIATPLAMVSSPASEQSQPAPVKLTADMIRGLELRNIGPARNPGRVGDIAVDPRDAKVWYIALASGNLWKTTDAGNTWTTPFDHYGSYSLGCVTVDQKNPDIVWLGTGENQSQRSVGFGDGVYKSTDAGKTWKHMGLEKSEHVARFQIDPRNSDVVYVACQGPLWANGGDRGLYKTTDGGKTWKVSLRIGDYSGVTDVIMDPRNPEVLYAATYQRRRNNGMLIGGGPEAGIFKSTDGGTNWNKLTNGIPKGDLGRIALGISPQQPDVIYALIYAASKDGSAFFRSADGGATWVKGTSYRVTDPQYYGEIFPDPHKFDRVYAVDVAIRVTDDGGKTVRTGAFKGGMHSDNHAIWFNPKDPNHVMVGNDGGLYESKNGGGSFKHFTNMATIQYYRVATDNSLPFYRVGGGTQDNGSQAGPSRTTSRAGILNKDWKSIGGGDGFQARFDPENPAIYYSLSQGMAISRAGKGIRPAGGGKGGAKGGGGGAIRGNWDVPYIISPHSAKRLYLGGNFLFRTDDRGDTWAKASPDLTRQLDRSKIQVMDKIWGPGAVTPNVFTTDLSIITHISESPLKENLLYVGTDDGLIQVSENAKDWRKTDKFPNLPDMSYVSCVCASRHDVNVVYATFNNWQMGDFKPYVLKSSDMGKTWTSIAGNLPYRHCLWSVAEDHVNKNLLFVGSEFGLFVTVDGGQNWAQLTGGTPVVAYRDLEIQRRENDLACATFGRGFFILDDITPLRHLTPETLAKNGALFPPRKAYCYEETGEQVPAGTYAAKNPPFGAVFTYYLREPVAGGDKVVLNVSDATGKKLKDVSGPNTAGLHRVSWNLRDDAAPTALVPAGQYRVSMANVGEPQSFDVVPLPAKK